ncbi:effector-associated domain 2-containing protein [Saccharothrix syringae]|uniref:VMAP-C domain-containing protein n=1 Tax=Saccharothrix syringae TaxID=103733 RepID=UPI0012FCABA7|nr:hypothetical protein [Saccharothrix syringae]
MWRERTLSVAEHRELCDAFLRLPGMREPDSRELYIAELARTHLDGFTFPRHADAHHDVWSLLSACLAQEGGLAGLVEVVRVFHQGSRPMARLDQLLATLFPDRLLTATEHRALLVLLIDLDPGLLGPPFRRATSSFQWNAVPNWGDVTGLVDCLDLAVDVNGVPPLLAFVEHLAHRVNGLHEEAHRWLDTVATRLDLRRSVLVELCAAAGEANADAAPGYVVLQLQPDGAEPDRYLLSAWLQQPGWPDEVLFRDDVPRTVQQVAGQVAELVRRAHAVAGTELDELVVEFVLPRSLVHQPIDQWRVDDVFPHLLGTSHVVVVRSLDRMRREDLRARWRRKWRWLAAHGDRTGIAGVHWSGKNHVATPDGLFAELVLDDAPVAVVLVEPPTEREGLGWDELTAALYAGVPVVAWCREPTLSEWFEEEIRRVLAEGGGLRRLPAHVLHLRRKASGRYDSRVRLGNHITLLWDDADRIPEPFMRAGRLRAPRLEGNHG